VKWCILHLFYESEYMHKITFPQIVDMMENQYRDWKRVVANIQSYLSAKVTLCHIRKTL
jgi:hypothetical protein